MGTGDRVSDVLAGGIPVRHKDTAVVFFFTGLIFGMIVAFAACSAPDDYFYYPSTTTGQPK